MAAEALAPPGGAGTGTAKPATAGTPRGPLSPRAIAEHVVGWLRGGRPGPLVLELYPTLLCNLDCGFCDTTVRHRPAVDELAAERLLRLVDEAADLGARRVMVLGGGEPLARRDAIAPLLRRAKERGMEGMLTTNGTLLDAALARQLVETGWDEVHVSIDDARPEVHDLLRGRPGSFRRAVRATCRLSALRRAAGATRPRIVLHVVVTRRNWRGLAGLVRLAASLGAERVDFDALVAYTPEQRALRLRPEEAAALPDAARRALAEAERLGIATTLEHLLHTERVDRGATELPPHAGGGMAGAPCLRAWYHLVVGPDGRVGPCCVLGPRGDGLRDRPLAEAWAADAFLEEVRAGWASARPPARCRECSWNILAHELEVARHVRALTAGAS